MARVRLIGPEPVTVPELGSQEVQPDQVIDVPDERFDGYVCQVGTWESVEEPGARAAAARKSTAKTAKGSDH
jgi:hypothetical protein